MKYLVTGAAGFIGSHIVEKLLENGDDVIGVDNLITGKIENVKHLLGAMSFVRGDLRDMEVCRAVTSGVDFVLHQAAIGSVPRSVEDPLTTHDHNVNGTINILKAATEHCVKRFVYAASSSAYGDADTLPKHEGMQPKPRSPYAVSKLVGEYYCSVFHKVYGLPTVSLRYFNVFGPRQNPDSQYAAVIPKLMAAIQSGKQPVIFGTGEQTRDFTYISNVVDANIKACYANEQAFGHVFNIGGGHMISINALAKFICQAFGSTIEPLHETARVGDVAHSLADITLAREVFGYKPTVDVYYGLEKTTQWFVGE